jgi:hypothetical protein
MCARDKVEYNREHIPKDSFVVGALTVRVSVSSIVNYY